MQIHVHLSDGQCNAAYWHEIEEFHRVRPNPMWSAIASLFQICSLLRFDSFNHSSRTLAFHISKYSISFECIYHSVSTFCIAVFYPNESRLRTEKNGNENQPHIFRIAICNCWLFRLCALPLSSSHSTESKGKKNPSSSSSMMTLNNKHCVCTMQKIIFVCRFTRNHHFGHTAWAFPTISSCRYWIVHFARIHRFGKREELFVAKSIWKFCCMGN